MPAIGVATCERLDGLRHHQPTLPPAPGGDAIRVAGLRQGGRQALGGVAAAGGGILSATILLALLEECNPDASDVVAAYRSLRQQRRKSRVAEDPVGHPHQRQLHWALLLA